jgi:hypothetical protein
MLWSKVFTSEFIAYLFVMAFFCVLSMVRYFFREIEEPENIHKVQVILSSAPEYDNGGEYGDPELLFYNSGERKAYKLEGYGIAYRTLQQKEIQQLRTGDTLFLWISKQGGQSKTIIGIELVDGTRILTLDEYNSHKENEWKDIWFVVLFINLVLWPITIGKWIRLMKTSKTARLNN